MTTSDRPTITMFVDDAEPTAATDLDTVTLAAASRTLALAHELNGIPSLAGEASNMAFNLARGIIRASYMVDRIRGRWAGEVIIERAIDTGEYAPSDLARYLAEYRATS